MLRFKDSPHSSPYSSFQCAPQDRQSPKNQYFLNSSPRPSKILMHIGAKNAKRAFEFGKTHVVGPKGTHQATIVWLHGLGDEGSSWAALGNTPSSKFDNICCRLSGSAQLLLPNQLPYLVVFLQPLAHLAYGTSNYVKTNAILKAAYTVGGQYINADIIQSSILGIRSHYTVPVAEKIRRDEHVFVIDRTNLRYLSGLPQKVDLVTLDLFFISILIRRHLGFGIDFAKKGKSAKR